MSAVPQSENQILLSLQKDAILHLTLNNGAANALSIGLMTALRDAIIAAGADDSVRVIVIGHVGKVFSAGHDLKELTAKRSDADKGQAFFKQTFDLCAALMVSIVECPKPVIAVINGLATAAGCQLVATCDLAIATDKATFCTPGVNIGLFCSTPMVALTRNIHRKQAMEMLLTGETIEAGDAKDYGLINRIVPEDYLDQVVTKYAATIASKSQLTVKTGKKAFYAQADMGLREAYDHTARVMTENMLAGDACEGIEAFIEKREAKWSDS
ncbi:enoyl-CoA hydratase [Ahrensia marina]|uniref:Enoyl-CoA hydratase domain-containing protein 3, mitochondrial n=1 Tax=Ahrensia marina TaxID=1514904 RepID=A0A0M9GN32_9HYPH|nr:enoyl-CoA hydratase [Ahrensia marina]KPB01777.1 enoyl-CoA hydratase [Ahrensia marina]